MATVLDPWDWSVDEVISYFDKFRLSSVDHRPHSTLPTAYELEKLFRLHDINGSTLLSDIDSTILRDDFQILSFGQRSAIIYAIKQLRQSSPKYKVRLPLFLAPSPAVASPPLSHISLPDRLLGKSAVVQPPGLVLPEISSSPIRFLTQGDELQNLPNSASPGLHSRVRPGETLVEDQLGRKRRKLTLPPIASLLKGVDTDIKHHGNIVNAVHQNDAPAEVSRSKESKSETVESTRHTASNDSGAYEPSASKRTHTVTAFLNPKGIFIDHIFYGNTKIGQPIDDTPKQDHGVLLIEDDVEDEFQVSSAGIMSPGNQQFVYKSLKYYFLGAEERKLSVGGIEVLGIYPYPERLVHKDSRRSITIFKPTEGGFEAIRDDALLPGQLPQDDAPQVTEWDYLSRWQNEDDTVLPQWGQSDTELEFSSGLLEEMEDEQREEEEEKANKKGPLALERVAEIIEDEVRNQQEQWKTRKLPLRESTARSTWFKAGGPRKRVYLTSSTSAEIKRLNLRMAKIKDNILGEVWTKESEVREQCEILEETVFELQESQFKKSIWEGQSAPIASRKPTTKGRLTKKKRNDGEDLVNSDSEMEEDNVDDFVVPDDPLDEIQGNDSVGVESAINPSSADEDASLRDPDITDYEPLSEHADMMDPISSEPSQTQEIKTEPSQDMAEETDGAVTQSNASTPTKKDRSAVIIELTSSSEQEGMPEVESGKSEEIGNYEGELETATTEQVSSWLWSELIERNDRKRLVLKILLTLSPRRYNDLRPAILIPSKEIFTDRFKRAMEALRRVNEVFCEAAEINTSMYRFVKLYICWVHCLHKYWENSSSAELQERLNEDEIKNLTGYDEFYDFVNHILARHRTPIIFSLSSPNEEFKNPLSGREDLISISSELGPQSSDSSEMSTDDEMPILTGKKMVVESKEAKEKRERAHLRKKEQEEREKILKAQLGSMSVSTDRIIVNTAKKDEHDFIYLNPYIGSRIKKHQVEGLQFMWREVVNAGQGHKRSEMQGCLLAHTMGLGKTMQAIALIVTIAECAKSDNPRIADQISESLKFSRTLIICPSSLIMNWQDELLLWTPLPRTDNIGEITFLYTDMKMDERLETVNEWYDKGGVLTVSYDLLRQLVSNKPKKADKAAPLNEIQHTKLVSQLIEGPNIIIADEAHRMKNLNSRTSEITSRFASRSRVALTGSPLANNLKEYFAMIDWIDPGYLGDFAEFKSRFQDPIEHGLYATSSKGERRAAMKLLQVLKINLEPKIHRADITVLKGSLKPKVEFVISVSLTPLQEDAYKLYIQHLLASTGENVSIMRVWSWLAILSLLCNHPKVFLEKLQEQMREKKRLGSVTATSNDVQADQNLSDEQISNALESLGDEHVLKIGIPSAMICEQEKLLRRVADLQSPQHSQKVVLFLEILSLSKVADDKVLVFSHSIPTIDYLESLFVDKKVRYSRLDGTTKMGLRNVMANKFNRGKTDVFLISTRAGGLGFNLPGANRVVLFDFNFNPTWEEQAIGRAYRIGQEKPVYVYRFISAGTFETNVYNKAVFKTQLASRVVDKKNPKSHASKSKDYLYEPKQTPLEDYSDVIGKDPVVLDQILAERQKKADTHIRSITTTETLQADAGDDLTEAELQEVYRMREEERLRKDNPQAYEARRVAAQMALFNESARTFRVNSMQTTAGTSRPIETSSNIVSNGGGANQAPPLVREVQAPKAEVSSAKESLPANPPGGSREVLQKAQNADIPGTSLVQTSSIMATQSAKDETPEKTGVVIGKATVNAPKDSTMPAEPKNIIQNNGILAERPPDSEKTSISVTQQPKDDQKKFDSAVQSANNDTRENVNMAAQGETTHRQNGSATTALPAKASVQDGTISIGKQPKSQTQKAPLTTQSQPTPSGSVSSKQNGATGNTERRAAYSRANWKLKNTPFAFEEEVPKKKLGRPRKSDVSPAEAVASYKAKIATAVKEKDAASASSHASAPVSASGARTKGYTSRRTSDGSNSNSTTSSGSSYASASGSRPDADLRARSANSGRGKIDRNSAESISNGTTKNKGTRKNKGTLKST